MLPVEVEVTHFYGTVSSNCAMQYRMLMLYFMPPGRDLDVHGAVYCRPQVQGADGRDDGDRHEHASLHLQGGQRGLRQRCHGARRYQHW